MKRRSIAIFTLSCIAALAAASATFSRSQETPRGPFGLSLVTTEDGRPASADHYFLSQECALCHPRQWEELNGSLHSNTHRDPLYRKFAELARAEAGEEVYAWCSGCHTPVGVVSKLVPGTPEDQLPEVVKAGITCDVCHQISRGTGMDGPFAEPGNASFVLTSGANKYGPSSDSAANPSHLSLQSDYLASSEFCGSCHSVIHPFNGLRLEHTYDEWKNSVYAEKGIQCQDCHMSSVEDAIEVARTLQPVERKGLSARGGVERSIHPHYFVGGNSNVDRLGGDRAHSEMAVQRLQSAARLEIEAPASASKAAGLEFDVVVTNIGAGHSLPTSLTELREMWLHVKVTDPSGKVLYESGHLDPQGEIRPGAVRFGSSVMDREGNHTHRPWEAAAFEWQRLIPAKGSDRETLSLSLAAEQSGPLAIEVRLLYRSAPPKVVKEVMGPEAIELDVVEMATAKASVSVR